MTGQQRPPQVGDTIQHYRLDHVIGVGGMGQVFGATDLRLNRQVALKVVLGQFASSEEFARRFQREAATLARLDSPHVIAIYDHGVTDELPFIVTQYAAGGDLGRRLRERGPMPTGLATLVCAQVADALAAAHGVGVVHRDVKPANVLLRDDRIDRMHVYLCDFGVALTDSGGMTTPGAVAGTWNYLAPERSNGDPGSPASDLYSVGCLLWELLTGQPPYAGSDVEVAMQHMSGAVPQLPGTDATTIEVNRILAGTLAKAPEHRYPSAALLRDDLRAVSQRLTHGLSSSGGSAVKAPGKRTVLIAGIAAAVLCVGAIGTGIAAATQDDDPEVTVTEDPTDAPTTSGPTTAVPDPVPSPTESTGEPTDEPTGDPTDPSTDTPPDPASGPVLGDVNGDGYGDVTLGDLDAVYVLASDGTSLGKPEDRKIDAQTQLVGDFNGDDQLEILRIDEREPNVTVTPLIEGAQRVTSTFDAPALKGQQEFSADYLAADLDGDNADDLVVATPDGKGLTLTVSLNRGDGSFESSSVWLETDLAWEKATWAVGDFDGDGADELVHYVANEYESAAPTATMLEADGTSLVPVGSPYEVPREELPTTFLGVQDVSAGDVDGDGTIELLGVYPSGSGVVAWDWDGSSFGPMTVISEGNLDGIGGIYYGMSDVNGDRRVDLVTYDPLGAGIRVNLSDGTTMTEDPAFAVKDLGDISSGPQPIGPVSNGLY